MTRRGRKTLLHFPRLRYSESLETALQDADLVLLLTEWQVYKEINPSHSLALVSQPNIVDGRNALDTSAWEMAG
ncbi:UDP binding domain-containing protein [Glutamicibacter uratoxydans]|uniref:UDP binding domain-containing protein n=1 Tax=Glutamicibacter uratoxydans TaxID=43667 RepID=UPI003D6FE30E